MTRFNSSKTLFALQLILIFLLMLFANQYVLYAGDDFTYMYSFADGGELSSLSRIVESIISHSKINNGRYLAHFLLQLFLQMPKWVFNVVNALMYTAQILLLYRLATAECRKINNILLFGISAAVFVFEPSFGEVNLWMTGSFNYLWGFVLTLLLVNLYADLVFNQKSLDSVWKQILFCLLGFIAGAYNEASSSAAVFLILLMLLYVRVLEKRKIDLSYWAAFLLAIAGYVTILLCPGQMAHTTSELSIYILENRLVACAEYFYSFAPLIMALIVLVVFALKENAAPKKLLYVAMFALTALAEASLFLLASSLPGRAATVTVLYLILACGAAVETNFDTEAKAIAASVCLILIPAFFHNFVTGFVDIHQTHNRAVTAVSYVEQCRENGAGTVLFPRIKGDTKYSIYCDNYYQLMDYPEQWPNVFMAKHFGVSGIAGVSEEDFSEILHEFAAE